MQNPRKLVATALTRVENDAAYSNLTLGELLKTEALSPENRALAAAVFYGTLDRKITIDYILSRHIKTPLKKVAPYTLAVLRSAVYQLMFMDKIPDSAAVNEAVKLIKGSGERRNAAFVNAVLRNILRDGTSLPAGGDSRSLSIRYSCPEWIIQSFTADYGAATAEQILAESLKPAPMVIRVNTVKTNAAALRQALDKAEIPFCETDTENALILNKGIDVGKCDLYKEGLFYVQDTASQKAAEVLAPTPGSRVLDLCAAPGGKSFLLAQLMENRGELVSCDLYEKRVGLIAAGAKRLGLTIIKPTCTDATVYDEELGKFDFCLCDVPCSGLGVLRRKPEIKYKPESDYASLAETQLKILKNAARYLKKGGKILYSTCTLRRAENENLVNSFLLEYNEFHKMYEHTFLPHMDKTDGFYCALLG